MISFYIKGANRIAVLNVLSSFDNGEGGLIQNHEVVFDMNGNAEKGIPIEITPAVLDGQTVVTPAEMSPDFHLNARINDDPHQNPEHTMTPERALELKVQLNSALGSMKQPKPTIPQRDFAN